MIAKLLTLVITLCLISVSQVFGLSEDFNDGMDRLAEALKAI